MYPIKSDRSAAAAQKRGEFRASLTEPQEVRVERVSTFTPPEGSPLADLVAGCELLMAQYDALPEFTMGGCLTNAPFLMIRAAMEKIGYRFQS